MRAVIQVSQGREHQKTYGAAMAAGLARHGLSVQWGDVTGADFAVVWGGKNFARMRPSVPRVLVMERGHVGDRMVWASCGWDGLAGRGHYPPALDGQRWDTHHRHLMQAWRVTGNAALIIGQVEGDTALDGLDLIRWASTVAGELAALGWTEILYRPHPLAGRMPIPAGTELTPREGLADSLLRAGLCVTYNSTAGVEAVLAGVPTVTIDRGSMAWPVAAHHLLAPQALYLPSRRTWAHDLAWSQWTLDEIASGDAWAALRDLQVAA